jgi:spore coat protein U domain-containing protein, fimbrial subunit CupE1/2/3/6
MLSLKATATRIVATVIACFALASPAWAGTATATLNVSATVTQTCKITTTDVVFGAYDPVVTNLSTALNAPSPGTLVVTCTKNASGVTLALSMGGFTTGGTNRRMKETTGGGTFYLTYQLYQPSATTAGAACAYTTIWGDGTNGNLLTPSGTTWGNTAPQTFNVCGQVPAGQDVEQGSYADVITATVNF